MLNYRSPVTPRGAATVNKLGSRRRRTNAKRRLDSAPLAWRAGGHSEAAQEVLRNTLSSACEVIGAEQGFTLQSREDAVLEVVCSHQMERQDVFDAVLGRAARSLHRALSCGEMGLADDLGLAMPGMDAGTATGAPSVITLPLDLGHDQAGALCLLRAEPTRTLSKLDLEILGALSDQAALALRAANQHSALNKLAARLNSFAPEPV